MNDKNTDDDVERWCFEFFDGRYPDMGDDVDLLSLDFWENMEEDKYDLVTMFCVDFSIRYPTFHEFLVFTGRGDMRNWIKKFVIYADYVASPNLVCGEQIITMKLLKVAAKNKIWPALDGVYLEK